MASSGPWALSLGRGVADAKRVAIDRIQMDARFQVRDGLDGGAVSRYAATLKTGGELPPVVLATINRVLTCLDGWHRIAAHRKLGMTRVLARHLGDVSAQQAGWIAAKANLGHGLQLRKRKELRATFQQYVRANAHRDDAGRLKSARAMSRDLQGIISHPTIPKLMAEYFPDVHTEMRNGPMTGEGGLPTSAGWSSEDTYLERIDAALSDVRNLMDSIRDAGKRGEVLDSLRRVTVELEGAAPWTERDPYGPD